MSKEQNKPMLETHESKLGLLESNLSLSQGELDFVKLLNLVDIDEYVAAKLFGDQNANSRSELITYGKEKGFNFTEEDIDAVDKEIFGASNALTDNDLEQVAGGETLAAALVVLSGTLLTISADAVPNKW